jgi:hypothetical protein
MAIAKKAAKKTIAKAAKKTIAKAAKVVDAAHGPRSRRGSSTRRSMPCTVAVTGTSTAAEHLTSSRRSMPCTSWSSRGRAR